MSSEQTLPPRCRWCKCFVSKEQEQTTRTVKGVRNDVLAWRTFTQLLCPACAREWSSDRPWSRAATADEVAEHVR